MDFMARARLYGQAVGVIDEFLGEQTRIKVMEHFSKLAGPMQRRGMKDPWEMIAQSAKAANVQPATIQALQIVYLMRTGRWDQFPVWAAKPDEAVIEQLRTWGMLGKFEAHLKSGKG